MPFSIQATLWKVAFAACAGAIITGCNAGAVTTAGVGSVNKNAYALGQSITYPNFPPATGVGSFDISFVDGTANQYYLADRSTSGVDVINLTTLAYVMTAGAGKFTGNTAPAPGESHSTSAGPNGIVPVGGGVVFAGDGDSTLKVVNVNTGALLGTTPAVNPYTGPALPGICTNTPNDAAGTPTTGAGNRRLDEMAYDPTDGIVLAISDAACPPFGTFFSTTAPYAAVGTVSFPNANGGAEQPTWDPTQKLFIMALPSTVANPGGEVDLIDPHTFAITKRFATPQNCGPAGTALGPNETLFLGCGGTSIITINATTGALLNSIPNLGGCDEVWYNPNANRFYAGCSTAAPSPLLVVADSTGALITSIVTSTGAHSVAADPATDHIFLPTQKSGVQVYTH